MGAWVTYGLGSASEDLPAFVVLPDPRGLPPGGVINWGAGFLPAIHQGTTLNTVPGQAPIADLFPQNDFARLQGAGEAAGRDFLQMLNRSHAADRPGNTELDARIGAYELAARLQLSAPEATDLSGETEATKALYNTEHEAIGALPHQVVGQAGGQIEIHRAVRSEGGDHRGDDAAERRLGTGRRADRGRGDGGQPSSSPQSSSAI
jgi:hypothetical protein